MTFIDYIKTNHPDPDALMCKPAHEVLDELTRLHNGYLVQIVESAKLANHIWFSHDINYGVTIAINKIKQS